MTKANPNAKYKEKVTEGAGKAQLYARQQIPTKCDAHCREFRFSSKAKSLVKEYDNIWNKMKWTAWICAIFAGIAILLLIGFLIAKAKKIAQK